jgi:hypothetical protein
MASLQCPKTLDLGLTYVKYIVAHIFLLLFFEKCISIIDMFALSLDKEGPMNIRQAVLGAGVAVLLVFGADADPAGAYAATAVHASAAQSVCDVAGLRQAMGEAAEMAGNAVLNAALDVAGELKARAKQVF